MRKHLTTYDKFVESLNTKLFEAAGNAGEAVEGFLGAILLYYNKPGKSIPDIIPDGKELSGIIDILESTKGKDGALFQPGDENHINTQEVQIAAFSAAIAIKEFLKSETISNVWRTGRTWPKELVDLGLNTIGGKDYNSSDIVIKHGQNQYTGVSLKAKAIPTSVDPTVINKSVTAVIEDSNINKEIKDVFQDFCQNVSKPLIDSLMKHGIKFKKQDYAEMYGKALKNVDAPEDIIKEFDIKAPKGKKLRIVDVSRIIIGNALKVKSNPFYTEIKKALKAEVTPTFAETVYDAIFKPKLENVKLKDAEFNLILCTGMQKMSGKKTEVKKIIPGDIKEFKTIFTVLGNLAKSESKIDVIFNENDISDDDSPDSTSSLSASLVLGKTVLADLVLRFKGNYATASDLQFQAFMSKELKEIIHNTKQ